MLAGISRRAYFLWPKYFEVEPYDPLLEWRWKATVLSLLFNPNRGKGDKALMPEDWFGFLREQLEVAHSSERAQKRMLWQMKIAHWKQHTNLLPPIVDSDTPPS